MKKVLLLGMTTAIILALLTSGCLGGDNGEEEEELPNLGAAPNFTLTSIDNDSFSLSDFQGTIVILDFMATWCGPCKTEMGHLKEVYNNYDESSVQIITINKDESETEQELADFADEWGDDWIYAIDKTGDVEDDYSIGSIPVLVIIDQQGDIRVKNVGVLDYETISEKIDKLL